MIVLSFDVLSFDVLSFDVLSFDVLSVLPFAIDKNERQKNNDSSKYFFIKICFKNDIKISHETYNLQKINLMCVGCNVLIIRMRTFGAFGAVLRSDI